MAKLKAGAGRFANGGVEPVSLAAAFDRGTALVADNGGIGLCGPDLRNALCGPSALMNPAVTVFVSPRGVADTRSPSRPHWRNRHRAHGGPVPH